MFILFKGLMAVLALVYIALGEHRINNDALKCSYLSTDALRQWEKSFVQNFEFSPQVLKANGAEADLVYRPGEDDKTLC